jgi:hypothetical protein
MFKVKDQEAWDEFVKANPNEEDGSLSYGSAVIEYARIWAELMEAEIIPGDEIPKALEKIADRTSHEANKELDRLHGGGSITGFMYSMAVNVLSQCWEMGEWLRQWHNLDVQVGDEGKVANKKGTVLNTALVNIAIPDEN